jgi:hypothetical protein
MNPRGREYAVVVAAAAALSLGFLLLHWWQGEILLYGDALAHIHIARRVLDSLTPGLKQLGTPWLPLPHLLMLPFLAVDRLWQSGVGAAIPSMAAYVLGAAGIYRLVRSRGSAALAGTAAAIYALNPNLLYLQTTAMTEPLALALFIWAVVYLSEFTDRKQARPLALCGLVLAAAILTRYDAWFYAPVFVGAAWAAGAHRVPRGLLALALFPALAAGTWLAYNQVVFGAALEFARGPHSARAIAERTTPPDAPPYPGERDPAVAAIYFQKAAKLNLGEGPWQHALLLLAAAGALLAVIAAGQRRAWLLLWLPLPVYTLSVAYGHVPIFVPEWNPFGYYNVRYGVQLLPAVAVFAAVAAGMAGVRLPPRWRGAAMAVLLAVAAGSYASAWRAGPISLREARVNTVHKHAFETRLAEALAALPPDATLLMYSGTHPGALQHAGIGLRRVISEGNHGHWEAALAAPAESAGYVVAIVGDAAWEAVEARPQGLHAIAEVEAGPHRAVIFESRPTT